MPWSAAFMIIGVFFIMILPVILSDVAEIIRALKGTPRERAPEKPAAPKPSPVYQDICHNKGCPGYGTTLTHKCHDLDCTMHGKKVSA